MPRIPENMSQRTQAMDSDALTTILRRLRLRAGVFVHAKYCGRWAVDTSGHRMATFHLIEAGRCWLHLPDAEPRSLAPGDLVVFPRDSAHVVSSSAEAPDPATVNLAQPAEDEPPDNVMLCGYFEFSGRAAWPILDTLPPAVVLERGTPETDRLIELIIAELRSPGLGSDAVVEFYAHVLFVQVLRAAAAEGFPAGVLAALGDDRIGRSLAALHNTPEQPWTLERLANRAAMSRTTFAQQFKALVGESPMRYLQLWRLQVAADLLAATRESVAAIAERSGYESEAAFRKAFRKEMGMTPAQVRKGTR